MKKFTTFVAVALFAFALSASASTLADFGTRLIRVGSKGSDVMAVQSALNVCQNSALAVDGIFGPKTAQVFMAFQTVKGIKIDGIVGPQTKATLFACSNGTTTTTTTTTTTGTTTLSGGAGSIDDYSLISGLSNEEVGEDESDVKVVGLEVENGDGSDVKITAMKLVFNEGTATSDFEDYADEVSVWYGTKEVARLDGDEFNDDNDWSKTVSFDEDAVIKSDETGKFYVAVSGISNLDSNDAGDTWTVDMTSVRFMDAQGAVISEDPGVAATTFSFETFSAAADTNFKITSGDEDINDAHVINVDATDDTNGVEILSFNVEVEGDSDVNLDALPVNFDVTGATNVDDMITGLELFMDGDSVGSASVSSDCIEDADCSAVGADETYLFDNLDLDLKAGKDYDFVVKVDLLSVADNLDVGDTIAANFGETQTDLASFKAEDEARNDLADADLTGTVTGSASEVRDIGINVKLVGTPTAVKTVGDAQAPESDSGLFTITFDVTAFDGDAYIDLSDPLETGSVNTGGADESDLTVTGTGTVTSNITSTSGATVGTDGFLVEEGETETFAITTNILATATGFFSVKIGNIVYALTDVDGTIAYSFDLGDFKTTPISLTDR